MSILLLNEDELRQLITVAEAIDAVKTAFVAATEKRLHTPTGFTLNLPEATGEVQVEGSYLNEARYFVIKVNSIFHRNPDINLPDQSDLIAIFNAETGFPVAIMVDNGYLSGVRAAAAGALAAQYLSNDPLGHVAVLGTGKQAYMQLKSLLAVRRVKTVSVWGRTPADADLYARCMVEEHSLDIDIAPSIEAAVRPADLIITTTRSSQPLIQSNWLKPGVHITAVGSNSPTQQELHVDVLARADVIIADSLSRCAVAGEIHHGLQAGAITTADVQGELGDLLVGNIPGRTAAGQISVADLTGIDMQDTLIATLALDKALFLGLGQHIETRIT